MRVWYHNANEQVEPVCENCFYATATDIKGEFSYKYDCIKSVALLLLRLFNFWRHEMLLFIIGFLIGTGAGVTIAGFMFAVGEEDHHDTRK